MLVSTVKRPLGYQNVKFFAFSYLGSTAQLVELRNSNPTQHYKNMIFFFEKKLFLKAKIVMWLSVANPGGISDNLTAPFDLRFGVIIYIYSS